LGVEIPLKDSVLIYMVVLTICVTTQAFVPILAVVMIFNVRTS